MQSIPPTTLDGTVLCTAGIPGWLAGLLVVTLFIQGIGDSGYRTPPGRQNILQVLFDTAPLVLGGSHTIVTDQLVAQLMPGMGDPHLSGHLVCQPSRPSCHLPPAVLDAQEL